MKQEILSSLKNSPKSFKDLAKDINIHGFLNRKKLDSYLRELIEENKIYFRRKSQTYNFKNEETKIGIFKDSRREFGFVELDDGESIFIPGKFCLNAFNGDSVKVLLFNNNDADDSKKRVGKIVRIIKRNADNIFCWVNDIDGEKQVVCEEIPEKYKVNIINKNEKYRFTRYGDIFIFKFISLFDGIVTLEFKEFLGNKKDSKIDILLISKKNKITQEFSQKLINNLNRNIDQIDREDKNEEQNNPRTDLRDKLIYTIDGVESKDLDDAISVEEKEKEYILGVHIADVSHYVLEGSNVDEEAQERSTSIYLLNQVYPMLPEVLSNNLCSLNPNEDKKTLTCEMRIDKKTGKIKEYHIFESIINSKFRLTYDEVNEMLSSKKDILKDKSEPVLFENLILAQKIANLLREDKLNKGMIDFKLSETKIELDKDNFPIRLYLKEQTESERLIEDFMVAANESVANFFIKNSFPSVFRVHTKPNDDGKIFLKNLCNIFNISTKIDFEKDILSKDIANLIINLDDNPNQNIIKKFLIQSMEKAHYSSANKGHYALGLKSYLHFTSPIRRYPDLMVHRLLKKYFFNNKNLQMNENEKKFLAEDLEIISKYSSKKERESSAIENKLLDVKKARFIENQINKTVSAKVVSITSFGIFVEMENLTQGMIPVISLNDKYVFNPEKMELNNADNNEEKFFLGQNLNVIIKEVNVIYGNITCNITK